MNNRYIIGNGETHFFSSSLLRFLGLLHAGTNSFIPPAFECICSTGKPSSCVYAVFFFFTFHFLHFTTDKVYCIFFKGTHHRNSVNILLSAFVTQELKREGGKKQQQQKPLKPPKINSRLQT